MHNFKLGNLKARDQFVKFGVEDRIILKLVLKKQCERAWTLPMWLRIGVIGLLSTRQ